MRFRLLYPSGHQFSDENRLRFAGPLLEDSSLESQEKQHSGGLKAEDTQSGPETDC